jgi:undecaprenyl phosphate-alpha-L-ara4N flippase subunit ArnF
MRQCAQPVWYLNPYFQIALGALLVSGAEVFMKKGAVSAAEWTDVSGFGALTSGHTWAGIVFYILSFASWLCVLRLMPLVKAFSLMNFVHALVPAAAWLFLNESLSFSRAAGIILVLTGTILVAGAMAKAEEKL